MPATTTLKLPETLKKRIAPLAQSAGKTPHAWMVEALETQAVLAEKRKAFIADPLAARKGGRGGKRSWSDRARFGLMADGQHESPVACIIVAVEGEITASAARNGELAIFQLHRAAEQRMKLKRFDRRRNQLGRLDGHGRIALRQKINESQKIG